jgi:esterase/lipase superfamily enzyme
VTAHAKAHNIERIFVATTRQRSDTPYDFSGLRTSEVSYARYDISLPPTHAVGKIEWPKSTPNSATDFVVIDAEVFPSTQSFRAKLRAANKIAPDRDEAVVFIHGYNNNFAEALYRFAQISADMDLQGTPILYSWPSTEKSYEYLHDRDSVLFARDGLQSLLEQLVKSGTKKVTLVAHSIGSTLLMETLRQLSFAKDKTIAPIIDGVVLISPDIDETLFQMQLRSLQKIPEPFIIFSDDKDIALKISSFLTGRRNRLGQITNADVLAKYGILVIDTSDFEDGDGALNHSVTLTSPSIIAILRELPAAVELTEKTGGNPRTLLQTLFNQ